MYGWRDFGGETPPIIRGLGINGACWESVGAIWPCMMARRKRKAAMISCGRSLSTLELVMTCYDLAWRLSPQSYVSLLPLSELLSSMKINDQHIFSYR